MFGRDKKQNERNELLDVSGQPQMTTDLSLARFDMVLREIFKRYLAQPRQYDVFKLRAAQDGSIMTLSNGLQPSPRVHGNLRIRHNGQEMCPHCLILMTAREMLAPTFQVPRETMLVAMSQYETALPRREIPGMVIMHKSVAGELAVLRQGFYQGDWILACVPDKSPMAELPFTAGCPKHSVDGR